MKDPQIPYPSHDLIRRSVSSPCINLSQERKITDARLTFCKFQKGIFCSMLWLPAGPIFFRPEAGVEKASDRVGCEVAQKISICGQFRPVCRHSTRCIYSFLIQEGFFRVKNREICFFIWKSNLITCNRKHYGPNVSLPCSPHIWQGILKFCKNLRGEEEIPYFLHRTIGHNWAAPQTAMGVCWTQQIPGPLLHPSPAQHAETLSCSVWHTDRFP